MKLSQIIVIAGSLFLLSLFVFPMWEILLEAPQYPEPIGMEIWINKFTDSNPNDIKNINIMNHYVGMKPIPEEIPEFNVFPWVVIGMVALGVLLGLMGRYKFYLYWIVLMVALGSAGIYDFYLWEYEYGHNLKENAAIKFTDESGEPMAYQPPLIGRKKILNFVAISQPVTGAYLMFTGILLVFLGYVRGLKESNHAPSSTSS